MQTNSDDSVLQQLVFLRRLTELTGVLHEAQIMHLKLFWGLISDGTGKEFAIDPEKKQLEFRLPIKKSKFLKGKTDWFQESIETVLGNGWHISVKKGNKVIFHV
jgi:hypothetical protein